MFVIGVFAKDAQSGDLVQRDGGAPVRVSEVRFTKRGEDVIGVQLVADEEEGLTLLPNDIVQLLARAQPEGKTEDSMLRDVALVAVSVAHLGEQWPPHPRIKEFLPALRETLDAYELAKLLEDAPKTASVPDKARSVRLDDPAGGC